MKDDRHETWRYRLYMRASVVAVAVRFAAWWAYDRVTALWDRKTGRDGSGT